MERLGVTWARERRGRRARRIAATLAGLGGVCCVGGCSRLSAQIGAPRLSLDRFLIRNIDPKRNVTGDVCDVQSDYQCYAKYEAFPLFIYETRISQSQIHQI